MKNEELKEFALKIIKEIRDETIDDCFSFYVKDIPVDKYDIHWSDIQTKYNVPKHLIEKIVLDCIDCTLSNLLDTIDNDLISLYYKSDDGRLIDLYKEGKHELKGFYVGEWREKLSVFEFNQWYDV